VRTAGPLYSVIGLAVIPFFWCFPVGLVTAELATAFPQVPNACLKTRLCDFQAWALPSSA
jgi:hypothetical protein